MRIVKTPKSAVAFTGSRFAPFQATVPNPAKRVPNAISRQTKFAARPRSCSSRTSRSTGSASTRNTKPVRRPASNRPSVTPRTGRFAAKASAQPAAAKLVRRLLIVRTKSVASPPRPVWRRRRSFSRRDRVAPVRPSTIAVIRIVPPYQAAFPRPMALVWTTGITPART